MMIPIVATQPDQIDLPSERDREMIGAAVGLQYLIIEFQILGPTATPV